MAGTRKPCVVIVVCALTLCFQISAATSMSSILVVRRNEVSPDQNTINLEQDGSRNQPTLLFSESKPEKVIRRPNIDTKADSGKLYIKVSVDKHSLQHDEPKANLERSYPVWRMKPLTQLYHPSSSLRVQRGVTNPVQARSLKQPQVEHRYQTPGVVFSLQGLYHRLQRELEGCYFKVIRSQSVDHKVHSPAQYGYQVCSFLEEILRCTSDSRNPTISVRKRWAMREVKDNHMKLCNSACPTAQALICEAEEDLSKTECERTRDVIACKDTLVTELDCKPDSKALVYWLEQKIQTRLQSCDQPLRRCQIKALACVRRYTNLSHDRDEACNLQRREMIGESMSQCLNDADTDCILQADTQTLIAALVKNYLDMACAVNGDSDSEP